ncbi:hypothetical protein KC19_2G275600 [Ceratodon purpureus]|uniref:Dirigent protein n=1 Tax=Ceratodon purpureus TaxID=3225 RepID=A0A8T0J2G5_CERPU|nr:hypothetical protein KC19_2G275600 [Ceratodon purpureus]KAG0588873.1 hypothetical protein KC19_2G275600 [Ceratodon purpureus]
MTFSSVLVAYTLCALLCICSLQTVVTDSLHLQYYTHEFRGGPNSTLLITAGPGNVGNFSTLGWGSFLVFDNIVREGISANSTLLGKTTGTTILTGKAGDSPVQFIAQTLFNENYKYNGSSFIVLPGGVVLGSTGYFQGYKGYGQGVEVAATPTPSGAFYAVYLWDVYLED